MKRFAAFLVLAAAALSSTAIAQTPAPAPTCPSTKTLDDLMKAVDAAISGPTDQDRTCFRDLFLPDAQLAPIVKAPDGSFTPHLLTVDGWIAAVQKSSHKIFYEHQAKYSSDIYGNLAHLWSTYEVRLEPDAKPLIRGINSFQAVNDGTRWRFQSIVWLAETPDTPIPAKYLP